MKKVLFVSPRRQAENVRAAYPHLGLTWLGTRVVCRAPWLIMFARIALNAKYGAPRASPWFLHHFGGICAPSLKLWSVGDRSIPDYAKHADRQATSGYPLAFIHG